MCQVKLFSSRTLLGPPAGTPGYDLQATTPYGIPAGTPGYAETPGGYTGTPAGVAGTPGYTPGTGTPQGTGLSSTTPGTPGYDARSPAIGESGAILPRFAFSIQ